MGRLIIWALLISTPLSLTAYGQDADQERAKALYSNGKMLFDEGRFTEAMKAWQEAYEMSERPLLLYNIALAQTELKLFKEAIESLYQYRIYAPKDQQEKLVQQIADLKTKLAEKERLQALEQEAAAKEPVTVVEAPSSSTETTPPKKPKKVAAIAMWGGTALLATGGAVFAAMSAKSGASYETHCAELDELNLCTAQADHYYGQQKQLAILADASWGLSLASGGVALWLTLRKPSKAKTLQAKGASFILEPTGVRIKGRF